MAESANQEQHGASEPQTSKEHASAIQGDRRWSPIRDTAAYKIVMRLSGLLYCCAILVTVLVPWDGTTATQIIAAAGATFAIIGILASATPRLTLPGEKWTFMVVGFAGLLGLLSVVTREGDPWWIRTRLSLLMLSGIVAAFGLHLTVPEHKVVERN